MGVKLYYGGFGDYKVFAVAENNEDAVKRIGEIINAPFLPVTAEEISKVDGYEIRAYAENAVIPQEVEAEKPDAETRKFKCKQCGAEFDTLAELGRHSKQEHPKKGE